MSTIAVARASRPDFLVLAPLCVVLGVSLAACQSVVLDPLEVVLVLIGGLLAHVAVNLLNEYDDFRSGLDMLTRRTPFSGGSGALPETPSAAPGVLITACCMLAVVVAIGIYFLWLRGWPMLVLGSLAAQSFTFPLSFYDLSLLEKRRATISMVIRDAFPEGGGDVDKGAFWNGL
jgi:1,4-dihydroxy-2-naphthoate octaprenyltransferase